MLRVKSSFLVQILFFPEECPDLITEFIYYFALESFLARGEKPQVLIVILMYERPALLPLPHRGPYVFFVNP